MQVDASAVWAEVRPILGPLIQAFVVLAIGFFTIRYQQKQAATAERKLMLDLHDKRYEALTKFTSELFEIVNQLIYDDDEGREPFLHLPHIQKRSRARHSQMQQLSWLYGDDVMFPVTRMHHYYEEIEGTINRLRHRLDSDNQVQMVEDINWYNDCFHTAMGQTNDAARAYLSVGSIKAKAPPLRVYKTKELEYERPGGRPDAHNSDQAGTA